jgi:hypothetical protein
MHRSQRRTYESSTKYRSDTTEPDTSGGWGPRAELVDRSLPAYTPAPSNPSSMGAFVPYNGNGCLFSGEASSLDAFSSYLQRRGCPATALSDNRLTRGHSVPFLSYWGPFPLRQPALPADKVRPVSRRSKPSSRSLLIGEQPHPWPLMQGQDRKSRHRGTKPRGRWGLSPATSLLSLG